MPGFVIAQLKIDIITDEYEIKDQQYCQFPILPQNIQNHLVVFPPQIIEFNLQKLDEHPKRI